MSRKLVVTLIVAICAIVVSSQAWAEPPSDAVVRRLFRNMLFNQALYLDQVSQNPFIVWGIKDNKAPTQQDLDRQEDIRNKINSLAGSNGEKIFVGEKTKEPNGMYSVVVELNNDGQPTSIEMIKGASGWVIKCYQAQDGSRRCY